MMLTKLLAPVIFLLGSLLPKAALSQSSFYATDTVQLIEITFAQPDWDYQLDTAKAGSDGYILAAQVVVNGVVFDSAGVKYKGNSSYDSSRVKNPLHIKLDYIHGNADYEGVEDIKLGNGFFDPSMVREVLAYEILRNYMAAPLCNFARVFINGTYYGVFSNSESIDGNFLSTHFYSSENTFFKCNPQNVLSGQVPNLLYLGTDSANYYPRYEIKSDYSWRELISLCDTLANTPAVIDTILDVDRTLWMIAFNNVAVNLDSYSGAFAQNYYLYRDDNGRFVPVLWDLNMCFGGFTNTGLSNLSIAGMQQMTPVLHSTNGARPLIMKLLADTTYYRMYIAHMRTITNEFFSSGAYLARAQELQSLIDTAAQSETFSLYTYSQFQQGVTTTVAGIPGISTLMGARATYLASTSQFQQSPPVITNVAPLSSTVSINDTIRITCSVSGASAVMLGYRDQQYKRFTGAQMYDDGLHQDGAAADGIYGGWMSASSARMQYYVYAENSAAGAFSPERAEYEFYEMLVAVTAAGAGEVVINEFIASNQLGATNEAGNNEDWIELYNRTGSPLSLSGLYLSDDYSNPLKSALPDVILPAYSTLIIWADGNSMTSSYAHCNFKLSAGGEQLMLSTASGAVLDSITFGPQTTDYSTGRCPNGTGAFVMFASPTFDAFNTCPASVEENTAARYEAKAFPNPSAGNFTIVSNHPGAYAARLVNAGGQEVSRAAFSNDKAEVSAEELAAGFYFFRVTDADGNILQTGKIVITK
jgi:hypothetical protein